MEGIIRMGGTLTAKVTRAKRAPLSWKLRNNLRWSFIWGWLCTKAAHVFTHVTGIPTMLGQLSIRARLRGQWIDYGVVSYRVITTAAVNYIVDDWDGGAATIDDFNYHGCGTGAGAEAVGETALVTECTAALNPNDVRATGVKTQPSANVAQSVGVVTFDAGAAVIEHGILTQAATGGGTLLDRSLFAAINVIAGDTITFTYQWTLTAGG